MNKLLILLLSIIFVGTSCYYSEQKDLLSIAEIKHSTQHKDGLSECLKYKSEKGWLNGVYGSSFLNFYFDKPVYIDSISFVSKVFPISNTEISCYIKLKGSSDSIQIKSIKTNLLNDTHNIYLNMDNIYSLVFYFKNDSSWINICNLTIKGKEKNNIDVF